jgi:anhydro-N-acetylmuramic acid kinase
MNPNLYIGLMSGTSLDGVDAALVDLNAPNRLLSDHYEPFSADLRSAVSALLLPGFDEISRCAAVANELSRHYAKAVNALLRGANTQSNSVRAIGCHGQTVRHQPQRGYTLQLVNGALLAELTGISVVCDFRSRDIAAAGQGAPLVPAFHAATFRDASVSRVIVNLGGIANITFLPAAGTVTGFDCGPANGLLDEWIEATRGLPFDAGGNWASGGKVIPELLEALLSHPFFPQDPPKSTGRDVFSLDWVRGHLTDRCAGQDVQATLAELSARGVADSITRWCEHVDQVFLCGGGTHNTDLVKRLRALLGNPKIASTAALGVDPDWVEALAFAWLARETIEGRPGNLAAVTGASGPRCLGCVYPA